MIPNNIVTRVPSALQPGGKGKLAATKELNTRSGAAGSAANQQWRGQRAVAGLAAAPAMPFRAFQLLAPLRPPFAALPFLNSQVRTTRGDRLLSRVAQLLVAAAVSSAACHTAHVQSDVKCVCVLAGIARGGPGSESAGRRQSADASHSTAGAFVCRCASVPSPAV